ncbi:hypothetical protein [Dactylosporangium sp. NPDC051541]|uniref:hypothetical protein n=1 Tax=Dactylosporangium sp. NPDC051541 TaxID=3363977 RepID=UPI0037ACDB7C
MSITDEEFAQVRRAVAYRAALWLIRFELLGLVAFIWLLVGAPSALSWLRGVVLAGVLALAAAAMFLQYRAGYPVLRMRTSRPQDRRITRTLYGDISCSGGSRPGVDPRDVAG